MNRLVITLACVGFAALSLPLVAAGADQPETVMVTFRAKPGAEAELARVIESHWRVASGLNLLTATPHVTLRGAEDGGKTYFVEVFTWRDASVPDAAPPAVKKIWSQMNALVESRGGHPGLHFEEVAVVN